MSSWPILQLFRFSVAESAVDFGAQAVPMFQKEPVFTDQSPSSGRLSRRTSPCPRRETTWSGPGSGQSDSLGWPVRR